MPAETLMRSSTAQLFALIKSQYDLEDWLSERDRDAYNAERAATLIAEPHFISGHGAAAWIAQHTTRTTTTNTTTTTTTTVVTTRPQP